MNKAQIELCYKVVGIFNDAEFKYKGGDLLQCANTISAFAQFIKLENDKLNKPMTLAPKKEVIQPKKKVKKGKK